MSLPESDKLMPIKMRITLGHRLMQNKKLSATEKILYAFLIDPCGKIGGYCAYQTRDLMKELNMSERTLRRCYAKFRRLGLFEIMAKRGGTHLPMVFVAKKDLRK